MEVHTATFLLTVNRQSVLQSVTGTMSIVERVVIISIRRTLHRRHRVKSRNYTKTIRTKNVGKSLKINSENESGDNQQPERGRNHDDREGILLGNMKQGISRKNSSPRPNGG